MELIGLFIFGPFFFAPISFIPSTIYCVSTAFILSKFHGLRPIVLTTSIIILLCIIAEYLMLAILGAKGASSRFGYGFRVIHMLTLFFGPPAIANIALLLLSPRTEPWKLKELFMVSVLCWFACIGAVILYYIVGKEGFDLVLGVKIVELYLLAILIFSIIGIKLYIDSRFIKKTEK